MSSPSSPSVADIGDRHRRYSVLGIFSLGLCYTVQTAGHLLDPTLEGWVDAATLVAAAGVFVAFLPIALWKLRNRSTTEWRVYRGEDGFVHHTLQKAKMGSWLTTLMVVVVLETLAGRLDALPTEFALDLILAVLLLSFATVFLVQDRDLAEPSPDVRPGA